MSIETWVTGPAGASDYRAHLERSEATVNGRLAIAGRVAQRVFLGEHWDYTFQPENSGLSLKVAAAPSDVFEVGSPAVLALDPALLVAIE